MNPLEELGLKYGTDKIGKHHYLPLYYDMFRGREDKVKTVVELGVGEGAGLRMWREFFPNAMIYGADIDRNRIFKEDRIEVLYCDQRSESDLVDLLDITGTDIDLFIDDGSHLPMDQIFTCLYVMPELEIGNLYVIEDVAHPEIADEFGGYKVRVRQVGQRYDDRLIVVKKHG